MNAFTTASTVADVANRISRQRVSPATIGRFNTYSHVLERLIEVGQTTVSSEQLGQLSGASATLVRSDLMTLGFRGIRGVGYVTGDLLRGITGVLGLQLVRDVVIVGAGRLGLALASYLAQGARGLRVTTIYDADPAKIGTTVAGIDIRDSEHLAHEELSGVLAVIATPASSAQRVADQLVAAGVRSILNFAPVGLEIPSGVTVRRVDLAGELYVLSFFQNHHPPL